VVGGDGVKVVKISFAIITILLVAQTACAQTYVSVENFRVRPGESAIAPIYINNVTNFGTATIELHYDSSVVNVTGVTQGNIPNSYLYFNIDNPNGTTRMLVYTTSIPGPSGDFIYANLTLQAGAVVGYSPLDIYIEEFADPNGELIPAVAVNGSFTVTMPSINSSDESGREKDYFRPGEKVHVRGCGLEPRTQYKIWIQRDPVNLWDELIAEEDPSGGQEIITTNGEGCFGPVCIWSIPPDAPATYDEWDIVVDKLDENAGIFDPADGIDDAVVAGLVAPIPELLTLVLVAVGVVGVLIKKIY